MIRTVLASILILFVCVLGLSGCGKSQAVKEQEQAAKAQAKIAEDQALAQQAEAKAQAQVQEKLLGMVKAALKDPDSAKFQNVKIGKATYDEAKTKEDFAVCGEVNSKNSYGGYVGFKGFAVASNMKGEPTVYMGDMMATIVELYAKELGCAAK